MQVFRSNKIDQKIKSLETLLYFKNSYYSDSIFGEKYVITLGCENGKNFLDTKEISYETMVFI